MSIHRASRSPIPLNFSRPGDVVHGAALNEDGAGDGMASDQVGEELQQ